MKIGDNYTITPQELSKYSLVSPTNSYASISSLNIRPESVEQNQVRKNNGQFSLETTLHSGLSVGGKKLSVDISVKVQEESRGEPITLSANQNTRTYSKAITYIAVRESKKPEKVQYTKPEYLAGEIFLDPLVAPLIFPKVLLTDLGPGLGGYMNPSDNSGAINSRASDKQRQAIYAHELSRLGHKNPIWWHNEGRVREETDTLNFSLVHPEDIKEKKSNYS